MNILEKEIEDVIWGALHNNNIELNKRGFRSSSTHFIRQFNLGEYGIADIVGYKILDDGRGIEWEIIELKKDNVDMKTFLQALSYYKALDKISNEYEWCNIEIRLIGKSIDMSSSFCYMSDFFYNVDIYTYEIDLINGIKFKSQDGYCLNKENLFSLAKENFLNGLKKEQDGEPNT